MKTISLGIRYVRSVICRRSLRTRRGQVARRDNASPEEWGGGAGSLGGGAMFVFQGLTQAVVSDVL